MIDDIRQSVPGEVNSYDDWSPDPNIDVSCALPDLRYAFYIGLGAVIVAAALVVAVAQRVRRGKAA